MAAITASQVSVYTSPGNYGSGRYHGGPQPRALSERRIKITGVTAADTATAAVLGFAKLHATHSGFDSTNNTAVSMGVDPVNQLLVIGTGPSNDTVYLIIEGSPVPPKN